MLINVLMTKLLFYLEVTEGYIVLHVLVTKIFYSILLEPWKNRNAKNAPGGAFLWFSIKTKMMEYYKSRFVNLLGNVEYDYIQPSA